MTQSSNAISLEGTGTHAEPQPVAPRPFESTGISTGAKPAFGSGSTSVPIMPRVETVIPRPALVPIGKATGRSLIPLEEWEGVVDWVDGDEFGATLTDASGTEREFGEFSIEDEVSHDDEPLVSPGAVFYWTIARARSESGQRSLVSLIRFRRLPAWSHKEILDGQDKAAALARRLGIS